MDRSSDRRARATGCLLGGALGDALGNPVEFMSLATIRGEHGPDGIDALERGPSGKALITDDTQMTLFTADGMIRAIRRGGAEADPTPELAAAYGRWYLTQTERDPRALADDEAGWLFRHPELHHPRAPGLTCLSALRDFRSTRAANDSKGCGTVMRAAPFGFGPDPAGWAATGSELTHGHPEATAASVALAVAIAELADGADLAEALAAGASAAAGSLAARLVGDALDLARQGADPVEAVSRLGQGWVAEEALAVAAFCAVAAGGDVVRGLRWAVNHSGDSDSTGAIAGNLLGAAHGQGALPEDWLAELELREVIAQVAADLVDVQVAPPPDLAERYPVAG